MKILCPILITVLVVSVIPYSFAEFLDPNADPRYYLVRYYTEPEYQKWFDENFPNETIEHKLGYPNKIVTDEYYVNSLFNFTIKIPAGNWQVTESAKTLDSAISSIAEFVYVRYYANDEWNTNFNINYNSQNIDDVNYDDLLYWYSDYTGASNPYASQLKITNQTVEQDDDERYIIRYEFNDIANYPKEVLDLTGKKDIPYELQNVIVIYLYPNGDQYELIFSAEPQEYSQRVKEFNESANSFYVGKTEKLSDIIYDLYPQPKTSSPTEIKNSKQISNKGGCLIATATFGSELAPQVQQLRELRDNHLLQTASGTSFLNGFNQFYYSFSPTIANWERENPTFKEFVKIALTPMISSLSILNYVNMDSESSVLGYGISLIILNIGMYFVAPAIVIHKIRKKF